MRSTLMDSLAASKKPRGISALCGGPVTAKAERHKTLTGLTNTEPVVGAQHPRAQRLQWFLWESDWSEREVQAERLWLLRQDPATAPTAQGVLVIDETGVSLDGHKTAHVNRQYLANLGKIALQMAERALEEGIPFRAVVADSFYGEDRTLRGRLRKLSVPYVMALKPSHDGRAS
jgi:SRSO17 transposase